MENMLLLVPMFGIVGLIYMFVLRSWVVKQDSVSEKMTKLAAYIKEGALAFLNAEYRILAIFVVVAGALLGIVSSIVETTHWFIVVAFIIGAVFSAVAGNIGMRIATDSNVRTTQAARSSLPQALKVSFRGGTVMGLGVAGLAVFGLGVLFIILSNWFLTGEGSFYNEMTMVLEALAGFSLGAESIALFARVGGGIYTKAADVGADLVGKVEAGIPEDDPRNPATIADNVGDNVGDVAGMGADLYESYCGSILATAALGAAIPALGVRGVMAPMIVAGIGIILSIIGCLMVRCGEKSDMKTLMKSLTNPLWFSTAAIAVVSGVVAWIGLITWGVFGSVVSGLVAGCIIGLLTEYYTSDEYKPTQGIAEQAKMGPATAIIDGLAVGMFSSGLPTVTIVIGILAAFGFAGGFVDFASG